MRRPEAKGPNLKKTCTLFRKIGTLTSNPSSSVPTMANDNSATWAASTFEIYWRQVFSVCLVKTSYYAASVVKATAAKTRAQRLSTTTGPGLVGIPATQPISNIAPFVTRCESASPVVGRSSPSAAATQD